jgi:uncharacterized protein YbaP (TraB family)
MKINLKFLSIKLLLLFTVISSAVFGQKKIATNTLLWEVAGKGLTKPSYVFGTYHFAGKDFIDTMKVLNEKLKSADAVVGELIMDKDELMKAVIPYMMLKDTTLEKLFTDREIEKISGVLLAKMKVDIKAFNSFKPIALQVILSASYSPIKFSVDKIGIDEVFQKYAKAHQKHVYALETVEEQGRVLFGATIERQKQMLLKLVNDTVKVKQQSIALYQAYMHQDVDQLTSFFNEQQSDFNQSEMEALLKIRNEKWLAKLPEMMRKESLFIAVGAGHLFGNDGLIKGLQAKGYKVKPIATN